MIALRLGTWLVLWVVAGSLAVADQAAASSEPPAPERRRLVVIAPEALHPALQEFIAHKRQLLPTELRSLAEILRQTPGVDDPEKLKRFLYAEWRERGLGYALLVGDVDVLPVRYMVLDRVTPAAYDYAFYPCDLYYSDLAKPDGSFDDWNARQEGFHAGYFGEVRGEKNKQDPINFDQVDYRPEIAVGRWPVSTPEEARRVAAKTISAEERVLAGAVPRRAAFLAVGGWVDSRGLLNRLATRLTNSWLVEKRFYSDAASRRRHLRRTLTRSGACPTAASIWWCTPVTVRPTRGSSAFPSATSIASPTPRGCRWSFPRVAARRTLRRCRRTALTWTWRARNTPAPMPRNSSRRRRSRPRRTSGGDSIPPAWANRSSSAARMALSLTSAATPAANRAG